VKTERVHPADDRLIAMYFGDEEASADERRGMRQHLHGCEACTWRYTELTAPLERLRQDAATEADEVFTASRLDRQRAAIIERLDGAAPASRVIPFPSTVTRLNRGVLRQPLARWISAAAAASLLIGFAAGRLLDFRRNPVGAPVAATSVRTGAPAPVSEEAVADSMDVGPFERDELALGEIHLAVHTPRIDALSALDEMTPTIRPEAMIARARSLR
jgi:anti-sigma factor RsiW